MADVENKFPYNPLKFDSEGMSREEVLDLYEKLMLPRMVEEKMLSQRLLSQEKSLSINPYSILLNV